MRQGFSERNNLWYNSVANTVTAFPLTLGSKAICVTSCGNASRYKTSCPAISNQMVGPVAPSAPEIGAIGLRRSKRGKRYCRSMCGQDTPPAFVGEDTETWKRRHELSRRHNCFALIVSSIILTRCFRPTLRRPRRASLPCFPVNPLAAALASGLPLSLRHLE